MAYAPAVGVILTREGISRSTKDSEAGVRVSKGSRVDGSGESCAVVAVRYERPDGTDLSSAKNEFERACNAFVRRGYTVVREDEWSVYLTK